MSGEKGGVAAIPNQESECANRQAPAHDDHELLATQERLGAAVYACLYSKAPGGFDEVSWVNAAEPILRPLIDGKRRAEADYEHWHKIAQGLGVEAFAAEEGKRRAEADRDEYRESFKSVADQLRREREAGEKLEKALQVLYSEWMNQKDTDPPLLCLHSAYAEKLAKEALAAAEETRRGPSWGEPLRDAWDELRDLTGKLGEAGARQLADRIRQEFLRSRRTWAVTLHLVGSQEGGAPKTIMVRVEPPETLTRESLQAHNTRDGRIA